MAPYEMGTTGARASLRMTTRRLYAGQAWCSSLRVMASSPLDSSSRGFRSQVSRTPQFPCGSPATKYGKGIGGSEEKRSLQIRRLTVPLEVETPLNTKHLPNPPLFHRAKKIRASESEEKEPYCHTCGRLMPGAHLSKKPTDKIRKYCSPKCGKLKPTNGSWERQIEECFVQLLNRSPGGRQVVYCSEVDAILFDEDGYFRGSKDQRRGALREELKPPPTGNRLEEAETEEERIIRETGPRDSVKIDTRIAQPRKVIHSLDQLAEQQAKELKAHKGEAASPGRKVRNRELVRQAARRGIHFGFRISAVGAEGAAEKRAYVESYQTRRRRAVSGEEASFSKGDWGVRWKARQGP
ncbi:MAG: hypothetical protein MMC33_007817 [Icmadophila ericetorum]|nr:hypothetical protein [Icmadophila ericetorum]